MTAPYSKTALDEAKKKITKQAIRRYMWDKCGWYGSADEGFIGSVFEPKLPPFGGPTGTIRIRRNMAATNSDPHLQAPPGSVYVGDEYEGGLQFQMWDVDIYTSVYSMCERRVDEAFEGWDDLPEPSDFDGPIEQLRSAVTDLTALPSDGPLGTDFANVDLNSNFELLRKYVGSNDDTNESALVYAFDSAYGAGRVVPVMQNQAQAAIGLGTVMLGEQKLWTKAREDIMKLTEEAEKGFDLSGGGGSFPFGTVIAFVDLISDFVPAPLSGVLSKGSSALSFIEGLMPPEKKEDPKPTITGDEVDAIYDSMVDAIRKLSSSIWDQEYDLAHTTLQGVLNTMQSGEASQFHINPASGIDPELAGATQLDVQLYPLKRVGYEVVPRIAAFMGKAAESAQAANVPGIMNRGGTIGMFPSGPHDKWVALLTEFDHVTTGSGTELVEAGRLLAVGAGWLSDQDGYSQAALDGVRDDLDRGKQSWDNSEVGVTPRDPVLNGPGGRLMGY